MGTFFAEALVAAPHAPERRESVNLLVDTGSTYTWVSAALLQQLGVHATERRWIVTIEGALSERDVAEILVTLGDRTLHTVCLFGRERDLDVLGAYTLDGFGLAADPVQRRLVPAMVYGATGLCSWGSPAAGSPQALLTVPPTLQTRSDAPTTSHAVEFLE